MYFRQFLQESKDQLYFLKEQEEISESLNSPVEISKKETVGNLTLYFLINDKEFRVVLEKVPGATAIIFEQKIDGDFTYNGIQNNLSKSESLALFSTLKTLIKYIDPDINVVYTDSMKKLRLYLKILRTMPEINAISYTEDKSPFRITFSKDQKLKDQPKFKSKVGGCPCKIKSIVFASSLFPTLSTLQ